MNPERSPAAPAWARRLQIAMALSIGVAFAGFFVGTKDLEQPPRTLAESIHYARPHAPQPSVSYAQMRAVDLGPNAGWRGNLKHLATKQPDLMAEIEITDADKSVALRERAAIRAYNGAPPVVPHAIDQISAESCLACHGQGTQIGDRTAARISHPQLTNCTQCHILESNPGLEPAFIVANSFVGLEAPRQGERAYDGAPPTIPHSTQMRVECVSCHGPTGRLGIRSTHPWRQSCTQCHAPSAELDQYAFIGRNQ
jgi:cytochrome c-type protein NapB